MSEGVWEGQQEDRREREGEEGEGRRGDSEKCEREVRDTLVTREEEREALSHLSGQ